MTVADAIKDFQFFLLITRQPKGIRRRYLIGLHGFYAFAKGAPVESLTGDIMRKYVRAQIDYRGYLPKLQYRALYDFMTYCYRQGFVEKPKKAIAHG